MTSATPINNYTSAGSTQSPTSGSNQLLVPQARNLPQRPPTTWPMQTVGQGSSIASPFVNPRSLAAPAAPTGGLYAPNPFPDIEFNRGFGVDSGLGNRNSSSEDPSYVMQNNMVGLGNNGPPGAQSQRNNIPTSRPSNDVPRTHVVADPSTGRSSVARSARPHQLMGSFRSDPRRSSLVEDLILGNLRLVHMPASATGVLGSTSTPTATTSTDPAATTSQAIAPVTAASTAPETQSTSGSADPSEWSWDEFINWGDDDLNRDLRSRGFALVSSSTQQGSTAAQAPGAATASTQGAAVPSNEATGNAPGNGPNDDVPNSSNNNVSANNATFNPSMPPNLDPSLLSHPLLPEQSQRKHQQRPRRRPRPERRPHDARPPRRPRIRQPLGSPPWTRLPHTSIMTPLDAHGRPVDVDRDSVLAGVDQIMAGFETDPEYLAQLRLATTPLERAELARARFRRCWQVLAVGEIAPAVFAGASAASANDARPIYFVAGRDSLLETNPAAFDQVRRRARWGWYTPENRWAWIERETGHVFSGPHPVEYRFVDMWAFAERHHIDEIYAQRFPLVEEGEEAEAAGNRNGNSNGNASGSGNVDGNGDVNMN
ncbi:hypothetical protein PG994_008277 [Apiospora phragmitis]|uniref:Uncharacterized protein n=1 Tax=Apiospora phragmitis TaxID=2905665 RepID=A0ABR1UUZ9_9PEZI